MSPFTLFYHFLSNPFLLLPEPAYASHAKIISPGKKNLNKFQVMDSLVETSMSVDAVQDVVVVLFAKTLLDHTNVLADLDTKVSSKDIGGL